MGSKPKLSKTLKAKVEGLLSDAKKVLENEGASLAELKEAKESLQKAKDKFRVY